MDYVLIEGRQIYVNVLRGATGDETINYKFMGVKVYVGCRWRVRVCKGGESHQSERVKEGD